LEQIRVEWRVDPNEPDWDDTLPRIYREVMGTEGQWLSSDDFIYSSDEAALISELCGEHDVPRALFMKLIELEVSYEGYARRSNLQTELRDLLNREWGETAPLVQKAINHKRTQAVREIDEQKWLKRYEALGKVVSDVA
jgi:DNA sulfur modification protein DndC